jgi:hypothetical protein
VTRRILALALLFTPFQGCAGAGRPPPVAGVSGAAPASSGSAGAWVTESRNADTPSYDHVHPNPEGHRLLFEVVKAARIPERVAQPPARDARGSPPPPQLPPH